MTTEKEQEAFGFVMERHNNATSENDIRTAFQRFMPHYYIETPTAWGESGFPARLLGPDLIRGET